MTRPNSPTSPLNWPGQFDTPPPTGQIQHWRNLHGSAIGLALAQLLTQPQPYLIITDNHLQAQLLQSQITFFTRHSNNHAANGTARVDYFSDLETLPYDLLSPHPDITSRRIALLSRLPHTTCGITIIALPTLLQKLAPPGHFAPIEEKLSVGKTYPLPTLRADLEHAGYTLTDQVSEHGQYSVRGSLIDYFPAGSDYPLRIELCDDDIDSLRYFDPDSQRSVKKINATEVLVACEQPQDEQAIEYFRQRWRESFGGMANRSPVYQSVSNGTPIGGIEYYLPLFYQELYTFLDYLPKNTVVMSIGDMSTSIGQHWQLIEHRHSQLSGNLLRPLCSSQDLFLTEPELTETINHFAQIQLNITSPPPVATGAEIHFSSQPAPMLKLNLRSPQPLAPLRDFLKDKSLHLLICCQTAGRQQTMLDFLQSGQLPAQIVDHWQQWTEFATTTTTTTEPSIHLTIGELSEGLWLSEQHLLVLTENELFANFVPQRRRRKGQTFDLGQSLNSLDELTLNAAVVHRQHGVGRYLGLETLTTGGQSGEFMVLAYAEQAKVYIPIGSMNLISRYIGSDSEHAPLHHLGRAQWQKAKDKAAARIRDIAAELLITYSRRLAAKGFAFPQPDQHYRAFCAAFPFEETPDQISSIDAIIKDMTDERCMDRLICGDVGFGKTEVAMRAAFLAVMAGKQVAVLTPTTLLANQHERTFQDRFTHWPVKVAGLTRFHSGKEQTQIISELQTGSIDIIIGTHKLLNQNIKYKNLGLLIIDEEHRFGVRQKDRIKSKRAEIDILTMTATPIPRTLNLALTGTRDLSIIATPPVNRHSIETFIHQYQPSIIKEAITREIQRGGQTYFLHNKVKSIAETCDKIQKWLPQAKVHFAHGQMRESELEAIMRDFYNQQFNVLVTTTIIESGIDIPSANTIIIERADRFGLAELHQIRGRVGRSHHLAYAYLLTPPEQALGRGATKRLQAISQHPSLGAGFNLASQDLEIRGAGELLGENQSGQMHAIGLTLYMQMLNATVVALKRGESDPEPTKLMQAAIIDLPIASLLPDTYIHDIPLRLNLYKRLSDCINAEDILDIKAELIDRFGELPSAAINLLQSHLCRIKTTALGIARIEGSHNFIYYHFSPQADINHNALVKLIQQTDTAYSLQGPVKLRQKLTKQSEASADPAKPYFDAIEQTITAISPADNDQTKSPTIEF